MIPFQWISVLVLCAVIARILWRAGTQSEYRLPLALWGLLWFSALMFILLPQTSFFFARMVGIGRGVDLVIYLATLLLFYLVYLLGLQVHDLKVRQAKIIRSLALGEFSQSIESKPSGNDSGQ